MRAVGLKTLENKLSEYVRLATAGETVLVVDRDKVVAELVPPQKGRGERLQDAQLAEAVRQGSLTPPVLPAGDAPPRSPVVPVGGPGGRARGRSNRFAHRYARSREGVGNRELMVRAAPDVPPAHRHLTPLPSACA
jgi:antitoxin (DNA-binding transcriptional repressor) of toxin-antitoxin stability system